MQKIFAYIGVMVVGVVIGCLLPDYCFRDEAKMVQRDTIVRHDTMRYSRLELSASTYKLDVPNIGRREYVFFDIERLDTIYRDNVQYVVYPREQFYTETEDAQIWHSGIDSRIDSLNVFSRSRTIIKKQTVTKRNELSFGIGLAYSTDLFLPVQLEYSYNALPWLSVYGYAEYELSRKQFGIGAGTRVRISW